MSIPDQVPESSMEEILASIRKIISEDEATEGRSRSNATATVSPPEPRASNVSPLFGATPAAAQAGEKREAAGPVRPSALPAASAERTGGTPRYPVFPRPADVATRAPASEPAATAQNVLPRSDRTLPPGRREAAAPRPFDRGPDKPATGGGARSVEQLAEDLLRPMLRDWLDKNLPALVERLVREEIARVSRLRQNP